MSDHLDTLIGGAIGIVGTLATQWFLFHTGKIERKHKISEAERGRLQLVSDAVSQAHEWMESLHKMTDCTEVCNTRPSQYVRPSLMLCRIWFVRFSFCYFVIVYQR